MKTVRKRLSDIKGIESEAICSFLNSHFSTVFHEPAFNRIFSEVFGTEFSYYVAYDSEENMIGLCPVHSIRKGALRLLYSGLAQYDVPYGGWIYDGQAVHLGELLESMKFSFNEALAYWSIPQLQTGDYTSIVGKREFQTGIIDLAPPLEEILRNNIERQRRQDIRRAARKGVVVEELGGGTVSVFLEQCRHLKEFIGAAPFPDSFFAKLFDQYHDSGRIIALATKLNEQYLGSGVLIGNRHMTHLWIAGKPKDPSPNAPRQELLLWESIKWAKQAGSRYYDLCVVESERLPSIAQFKLSFSKNLVPFFHFTNRNLGYRIISRMQKWLGISRS
jgi:hypothetical protein